MVGLAAVFFPVLLMMFALSMERVEAWLRRQADRDQELTGGLEEVDATVAGTPAPDGPARASDVFRRRRRGARTSARQPTRAH